MTQITKTFNIVKRAYSEYTLFETFTGTWSDAMNYAMAAQAGRRDGEYLVRDLDEPFVGRHYGKPPCAGQQAWAYL